MKYILVAISLVWSCPTWAQYYPGPPMWDRRVYPDEGRMPPTNLGPPMPDCILYGTCRHRRYEEDPDQSWRQPRRRQPRRDYYDEEY